MVIITLKLTGTSQGPYKAARDQCPVARGATNSYMLSEPRLLHALSLQCIHIHPDGEIGSGQYNILSIRLRCGLALVGDFCQSCCRLIGMPRRQEQDPRFPGVKRRYRY